MLLNVVHKNISYLLRLNFTDAGIFDSWEEDVVVLENL